MSFIKYVGGKGRLINNILENCPANFNDYYEPFIGSGIVFYNIISNVTDNAFTKYHISDNNRALIICYYTIKNKLNELIEELSKDKYINDKECYLECRKTFNELKVKDESEIDNVVFTALFIYLNKCGFNGMYRENSKGLFNIPFGKMKNPKICDSEKLKRISELLNRNVYIKCEDYSEILMRCKKDDFVYMDPPYDDTFTDYTMNKFEKDAQKKLKDCFEELDKKGVKLLLSNSDTELIRELYKKYNIVKVNIKYSLGGNGANRGDKSELLIKNY